MHRKKNSAGSDTHTPSHRIPYPDPGSGCYQHASCLTHQCAHRCRSRQSASCTAFTHPNPGSPGGQVAVQHWKICTADRALHPVISIHSIRHLYDHPRTGDFLLRAACLLPVGFHQVAVPGNDHRHMEGSAAGVSPFQVMIAPAVILASSGNCEVFFSPVDRRFHFI